MGGFQPKQVYTPCLSIYSLCYTTQLKYKYYWISRSWQTKIPLISWLIVNWIYLIFSKYCFWIFSKYSKKIKLYLNIILIIFLPLYFIFISFWPSTINHSFKKNTLFTEQKNIFANWILFKIKLFYMFSWVEGKFMIKTSISCHVKI